MSWTLFSTTFTLVFLSELPDKTAFAAILMSGEGRFLPLFCGIGLAFFIQTLIAVWVGGFIGLLPKEVVQAGAGILFLVFSFVAWRRSRVPLSEETPSTAQVARAPASGFQTFLKAFLVIFAAEWGDLTQLSTASLAAKYPDRLSIFLGALLALLGVTALALLLGKTLQEKIEPRTFNLITAAALGAIGGFFLLEAILT